jgi:hypothetical protein
MAYRFEVVAHRYRTGELVTLFDMFPGLETLCSFHSNFFIIYGTDLSQPLSDKAKRELGKCVDAGSVADYVCLDERALLQSLTRQR